LDVILLVCYLIMAFTYWMLFRYIDLLDATLRFNRNIPLSEDTISRKVHSCNWTTLVTRPSNLTLQQNGRWSSVIVEPFRKHIFWVTEYIYIFSLQGQFETTLEPMKTKSAQALHKRSLWETHHLSSFPWFLLVGTPTNRAPASPFHLPQNSVVSPHTAALWNFVVKGLGWAEYAASWMHRNASILLAYPDSNDHRWKNVITSPEKKRTHTIPLLWNGGNDCLTFPHVPLKMV